MVGIKGRTRKDYLRELKVWAELLFQAALAENRLLRNFTGQQLDDAKQLVSSQPEADSSILRRFPNRLKQALACFCVLELNALDTPLVVQISRELVVGNGRLLHGAVRHELLSLIDEIVLEVVSQKQVQDSCLRFVIVTKGGGSIGAQKGTENNRLGAC